MSDAGHEGRIKREFKEHGALLGRITMIAGALSGVVGILAMFGVDVAVIRPAFLYELQSVEHKAKADTQRVEVRVTSTEIWQIDRDITALHVRITTLEGEMRQGVNVAKPLAEAKRDLRRLEDRRRRLVAEENRLNKS